MKKYSYLLKNLGLLTLSSFASRILSFILVPLYTSILSTEQYGVYDMFNTTIMLLIPILTIDIVDAVLRFSLDKDKNQHEVFAAGNKMIVISIVIVILFLMINKVLNIFPIVNEYSILFLLMYIFTGYSQLLQYYARGVEKVAALAVSSVIASVVSLSLNILFLVYFKWGLVGYFYATIFGLAIPTIYLVIDLKVWKIIHFVSKNNTLEKDMMKYSAPLVLNAVSWWMNNSSSRYIVIFLCGMAQNGIFSVGYKIPSILNVFQSIFNQAWTLSSVKEFDSEDKEGFFARTYTVYNFMMVFVCSMLILLTKLLAAILYAKDFYVAWKIVPFLMIAIVFGSISGLLGGIFSAVKDSKAYSVSTTVGAVVNILFGFIGVYFFGVVGAAFSNAISFGVVWLMRVKKVKEYMVLRINFARDIVIYMLLFLQSFLIINIKNSYISYSVQCLCLTIILLVYRHDIILLIKKIKRN
ncbi:oligosaccharide flippase family protein [Ligilactobacillus agilis]|uniref:lipopolysaccharide biosynthesis protein n=1 Tax=Ligilactobacillus agilis TaxID=1601 RepID=UPI00191DD405|nr:oligosaccharide flippase family protein [Ligilactobacillus agilis]MBL1056153.1 oligosaccharide flippase family protein [Ligilactobacillus agilis]